MEGQNAPYLRLLGKILGVTAVISLVVFLLGYFLNWDGPVPYSNAFFWAGSLMIVMGVLSVAGGFQQRADFAITYAESAGEANLAERGQRMAADITQRYGAMLSLTIIGILLIVISVVIA